MTAPWIVAQVGELVADRRKNPVRWLQQRLLLFLHVCFRDNEVGDFHWSPEEEESEIVITSEIPLKMKAADPRPAIQLLLGTITNMNLSFNNLVHRNMLTGATTHLDLKQGAASFNVLTFNDDEAKSLATAIAKLMQEKRNLLIKMTGLNMAGLTQQMTPISPPKTLAVIEPADEDSYMASVAFQFTYPETWTRERKQLPPGKHDPYAGGFVPKEGSEMEALVKPEYVRVRTDLYYPGVFERHRQEIQRVLSDPENVITSTGKVFRVIRTMDAARNDLQKRSPLASGRTKITNDD